LPCQAGFFIFVRPACNWVLIVVSSVTALI
jgi:hypothetical protein